MAEMNVPAGTAQNVASTPAASGPKPIKITITMPTSAYFMSGIRDFTLSLTKNMTGFSEQWAYRFQSVVDELCNNAIEHGSEAGQEIKISFISVEKQYIEIYVSDTGTGPSKKTAGDMNALIKERRSPEYLQKIGLRGRGLPQIVCSWTDEHEFSSNKEGTGLTARVKKYLKAEENLSLAQKSNDPHNLILK